MGEVDFGEKNLREMGLRGYWVKETGEELAKTCAGTPSQLGP